MEKHEGNQKVSKVQERPEPFMKTFSSQEEAELYRLKRDMERSDMEKLSLFTKMLRRNLIYKRAIISSNSQQ